MKVEKKNRPFSLLQTEMLLNFVNNSLKTEEFVVSMTTKRFSLHQISCIKNVPKDLFWFHVTCVVNGAQMQQLPSLREYCEGKDGILVQGEQEVGLYAREGNDV